MPFALSVMKSETPLKAYERRRKACAFPMPTRFERMERVVREMAVKQDHRRTYSFTSVRAAIKAVEEVSIGSIHHNRRLS